MQLIKLNITNFKKFKDVTIHFDEKTIFGFKTRDIFNVKVGQNIGFEQNGKGKEFIRPVIVYKKLTKDMFIGIPLTTTQRDC